MKKSAPALATADAAPQRTAPTVEQRWCRRRSTELNVNVIHANNRSELGRTSNIGLGGMFVRMNAGHLQANDLVIAFIYLGSRCYRTQAFVTRITPQGAALMFAHLDRNTLEFLLVLQMDDVEEETTAERVA